MTKLQIPNPNQIPIAKLQIPKKSGTRCRKDFTGRQNQLPFGDLVIGHWNLIGIWALGFGVLFLTGCCHNPPPVIHPAYIGPTDSMDAVVADINHNNAGVPTLWTALSFTARFHDDKKQLQTESGDGALSYSRPISLRLTGNDAAAGPVFDLGSNEQEFWVKLRTSISSSNFFWGHQANIGKPCCQPLPIDPQLVIEVLGISLYNTNFLQQPVPVMRFDNDNDGSYILDFNVKGPDRWITEKEIWYTRQRKLPAKVLLYDDNGRVILRANLSNHGPVEVPGVDSKKWPTIARHYELSFPDTGNQITFDFDAPATSHTSHHVTRPNAATFARPVPPDNDKVIQIDKDCN
jgi:hypothetical protein